MQHGQALRERLHQGAFVWVGLLAGEMGQQGLQTMQSSLGRLNGLAHAREKRQALGGWQSGGVGDRVGGSGQQVAHRNGASHRGGQEPDRQVK